MQLPSPADIIAVSPDQQWLAAATHDQKLYVWLRKAPPEGHWGEWCQRFLSPIPEPRTGAVPQP
jgi:hypothetical protein